MMNLIPEDLNNIITDRGTSKKINHDCEISNGDYV